MIRIRIFLILIFLGSHTLYSQDFKYRQEINGFEKGWNKFDLTDDTYSGIFRLGRDIRLIGIVDQDTFNIPFIINTSLKTNVFEEVKFETINSATQNNRFYFTFKIEDQDAPINEIHLNFNNQNYDWEVQLEGSMDQRKWYSILENHRIVSIKNEYTNFTFDQLNFPRSEYQYYRISFESENKPILDHATLYRTTKTENDLKSWNFKVEREEDEKESISTYVLHLDKKVPISQVIYKVNSEYEYFRDTRIFLIKDSIQTDNGWTYDMMDYTISQVNSLSEPILHFGNLPVAKIKVQLRNFDDEPLDLQFVSVNGMAYSITARMDQAFDQCFMLYGDHSIDHPRFDISRKEFENSIPSSFNRPELGDVISIQQEQASTNSLISTNWITILVITIVVFLGIFTLRLVRQPHVKE